MSGLAARSGEKKQNNFQTRLIVISYMHAILEESLQPHLPFTRVIVVCWVGSMSTMCMFFCFLLQLKFQNKKKTLILYVPLWPGGQFTCGF